MSLDEYRYLSNHRMAKLVVCLCYILIGLISIDTGNPYIALVCGTFVWFFGVNTVAYAIEALRGQRHQHRPL